MTGLRVAVFSGATPLHVQLIGLGGRITVIPMPLRDPDRQMAEHLRRAAAQLVVTDAAHEDQARRVACGLPVMGADALETLQALPGDDPAGVDLPRKDLAGMDLPRKDLAGQGLAEDLPRACLRTGGTTGEPQLVDLPAKALDAHHEAAMRRLRCTPESVWWAGLPLWHMGGFGLVDRCLHGGGTIRFGEVLPKGVTHTSLVPTMLARLVAAGPPPTSLRCALVGGDRLGPTLAQAALRAGWPVHASYGMTQTCGQIATALPEESAAHPGTSGRPLDGVKLEIRRGDTMAAAGEEGEIVVAGPTLAVPGPLATGDMGYVDDDGRLYVTGRSGDRITTGGEKVHPERVEDALRACAGVHEAGVVGVQDAEWGQRVVAFVVGDVDLDAVRTQVRAKLAPHEVPKEVRRVEWLPRTQAGKLRRAVLRQWHEDQDAT